MQDILTITLNPAVDKNASIDHVVPERKLRCSVPSFEPGGGGINVSRAIYKLGGQSTTLYLAGGPSGLILEQLLGAEGIKQQRVPIEEWTRENLIVSEKATGQQFRFGMPGPSVQPEEWRSVLAFLEETTPAPGYIVASGSIPPGVPEDAYAQIARLAKKRGSRFILDTSGKALKAAIKSPFYLLKPNIAELAFLEGAPIEDEEHLESAAQKLIKNGCCEFVVVSLGAGGAYLSSKNACIRITAPTVPIQSKVGAGDSMVAGLTLALAKGNSIEDSAMFGVAAGSAAVMTPGTQLCRSADTDRLFEQIKRNIT